MKKIPLNSILKTSLLLFGISLLLWNCRKEEFHNDIVLENFSSAYKQRTISLSELADVKKYIDQINPSNELGKTSEIEGAIFDQDNVLEVIDTLQNTNYSLRFTYPDTPASEFYNLIIGRTPEGDLTTPFVLKYVCDEDFVDNYIANDFDIQYFKGMIKLHKYTDFFSLDAFSRTTDSCPPELDAVGDPQVCEEQPIDGSSLSGGGNNDGGNYGNPNSGNSLGSIGGGSGCSIWVSTNGPCDEGGTEIHPPEACGAGTGVQYVIIIHCPEQRQTRTTNDCPSCSDSNPDGGIGLNQPSIISMINNIKNNLELSHDELFWLNNDADNEDIIQINTELNVLAVEGNYLEESIEFAEGLLRGNMIEDDIIDNNLEPCTKSILNDLKSLEQNDIARIIARFGSPSSKYDWEVKTGTPTNPINAAETDWNRDSNSDAIPFEYETKVKLSYINQATEISIVRTILHEMLHTYILSLVDDSTIPPGSIDIYNFPLLWNALVDNTYNNNPNLLHHEIISRHFIDPIKDALKEWDEGRQPDQYYDDLAWGALEETSSFNNLFPVGSSDRDRILDTNRAEDTNSNQNGINPKGSSCN